MPRLPSKHVVLRFTSERKDWFARAEGMSNHRQTEAWYHTHMDSVEMEQTFWAAGFSQVKTVLFIYIV